MLGFKNFLMEEDGVGVVEMVFRILFRRMAMKYRISRHLCTRKRRRMPTLW